MTRRLTLVAGRPSHASGEHEFLAGMRLLATCLGDVAGLAVRVVADGDLSDAVLVGSDAVVVFADGGPGHPLLQDDRLAAVESRIDQGLGFGLMHFALELPVDQGAREVTSWIGGAYLDGVSCNPIFQASFESFPEHPVTRGVRPFSTRDEWYFGIQFASGATSEPRTDIQPILCTVPSDAVRGGPYVWPHGPYDHIVAAAGRAEVLMWARERAPGRRAFGLTGGHFHANWADDDFRRVVLNALVWISGLDIPASGVDSTVTASDLDLGASGPGIGNAAG